MSKLPHIADYLPELFKQAEEDEKPIPATKDVLRAGLHAALITAGGTGLGYGLGKLVGYGADRISKKFTGQPIPPHYFPAALGVLGTIGGAAEAARMSELKEILRNAYQNRTKGRPAGS